MTLIGHPKTLRAIVSGGAAAGKEMAAASV